MAWTRFLPRAVLVIAAAGFVAWLLDVLLVAGFYLVGVVPVLLGMGLGALVFWAVRDGRCRNAVIGTAFGLIVGVVAYIGHFQVGMARDMGLPVFTSFEHVDEVPRYIVARMRYQVLEDSASSRRSHEMPDRVEVGFNWLFFALEFGFVVGATTGAGWVRSRRPFCERCGEWMSLASRPAPTGYADAVAYAIDHGDTASIAALPEVVIAGPSRAAYTAVGIHYCTGTRAGECPAYLSAAETKFAGGSGLTPFDSPFRRAAVRATALEPREVAALAEAFPALAGSHPDATPTEENAYRTTVAPVGRAGLLVQDLPPEQRGQVFNRRAHWHILAKVLLACVAAIGGIFVALGGMYLAVERDVDPGSGQAPILGWTLVVVGVAAIPAGLTMLFRFDTSTRRYYDRRFRDAVAQRRDAIVRVEDPESVLVKLVPRENWRRLMLEDAVDVGLLKIDADRRVLLFEGDIQRMRIPVDAITNCTLGTNGSANTPNFYMVVQCRPDPGGPPREFPFLYYEPRRDGRKLSTYEGAMWLGAHLEQLRSAQAAS